MIGAWEMREEKRGHLWIKKKRKEGIAILNRPQMLFYITKLNALLYSIYNIVHRILHTMHAAQFASFVM